MLPLPLGRLACGLAVCLAVAVTSQAGRTAEQAAGNVERVKFDTIDQVELHGSFYPSSRSNKAPCAILLHEIGGHSQQEGWPELAKELQKKGFAVLAFDFRGHGESTDVGPNFYFDPVNKTLKSARSVKSQNKISSKDFTSLQHYAMLVNDIAAAKRYLDRKNDSGECNSSDVVLIGAGDGATLGAFWLFTEWSRREPIKNPFGIVIGRNDPEGKNIACAVWLSISPRLGTTPINNQATSWFRLQQVRDKVPIYLINGEQDKNSGFAKHLNDNALRPDKSMKLTGTRSIQGSNKLAGRDLLGKKSLGTEGLIVEYLEKALEDRGATVWTKKNVETSTPVRVPIETFLR